MDEESQAGCDYFKEKLEINEKFVAENVKKHAGSDYWRMVEMFYLQMDGITQGFLQKSQEENLPYGDFDVNRGVHQINYLVDFFDYLGRPSFNLLWQKFNKRWKRSNFVNTL